MFLRFWDFVKRNKTAFSAIGAFLSGIAAVGAVLVSILMPQHISPPAPSPIPPMVFSDFEDISRRLEDRKFVNEMQLSQLFRLSEAALAPTMDPAKPKWVLPKMADFNYGVRDVRQGDGPIIVVWYSCLTPGSKPKMCSYTPEYRANPDNMWRSRTMKFD
jgi:hypothetical protein